MGRTRTKTNAYILILMVLALVMTSNAARRLLEDGMMEVYLDQDSDFNPQSLEDYLEIGDIDLGPQPSEDFFPDSSSMPFEDYYGDVNVSPQPSQDYFPDFSPQQSEDYLEALDEEY